MFIISASQLKNDWKVHYSGVPTTDPIVQHSLCMDIYIYIYMHTHKHTCYISILYIYMYVCVCVHVYIYSYVCTHMYTHTYNCVYLYIYIHMQIDVCVYVYVCISTQIQKYMCIYNVILLRCTKSQITKQNTPAACPSPHPSTQPCTTLVQSRFPVGWKFSYFCFQKYFVTRFGFGSLLMIGLERRA